jgi:hypothetical protein
MGTGGDDGGSDVSETSNGNDASPLTGLSVSYQVEQSGATSPYLGCQLSIVNVSAPPTSLTGLKLRYYYTDEVHLAQQMTINWSHVGTAGPNLDLTVTSSFGSVAPAAPTADSYIEFAYSSSHPSLAMGESAIFSWQMQGPDPSHDVYTQTNDYSFDASKTTLTAWTHVVLLQNGSVAWGVVP